MAPTEFGNFWNVALGLPLQLGNSIVLYSCRKICHQGIHTYRYHFNYVL